MTTTLFDIAADLDTPVSAYLKLKPFRPRFLLESVEGGERLARYSFIGFGDCLEYRLDRVRRCMVNGERQPRPADQAELLASLRHALARRRRAARDARHGFPLLGGLVGAASYDLVRYFERLPAHAADRRRRARCALPRAAFAAGVRSPDAPCRVAARGLRAGATRVASRGDPRAARRFARAGRGRRQFSPAEASLSEDDFLQNVARTKEYIAAGDVYQLVLSVRFARSCDIDPFEAYRALRLLNPSPYMYLLRARRPCDRRFVARGAGEARRRRRAPAARSRARGRAVSTTSRTVANEARTARRSEGERRARHARRPRAQRPRSRGRGRQRATSIRTARSSATAT